MADVVGVTIPYVANGRRVASLADRLWRNVDKSGSCWQWTGKAVADGYGRLRLHYRTLTAHRVAYELLVGPIPEGLELDHICRNRLCVRPEHLEPVDRRTNLLRGIGPPAINAWKTKCIRGHALTEDNIILRPGGQHGRRECRACRRLMDNDGLRAAYNAGQASTND